MGFHCTPSRDVLFIWGQFPVASPSHTGWAFLPRQPRPIGHTHFSVPACDSAFPQLLPAQLNSGGWWGPWRAQRCPPEGRRGRRAEEKGANHPLSADSVESQLLATGQVAALCQVLGSETSLPVKWPLLGPRAQKGLCAIQETHQETLALILEFPRAQGNPGFSQKPSRPSKQCSLPPVSAPFPAPRNQNAQPASLPALGVLGSFQRVGCKVCWV